MSEKPFYVYRRDDGIFVFRFTDMARQAADLYAAYLLRWQDQFPSSIRILYDLRGCAAPSPYFNKKLGEVVRHLRVPADTRNAWLTDSLLLRVWKNILDRQHNRDDLIVKTFTDEGEAVAWLLEGGWKPPQS